MVSRGKRSRLAASAARAAGRARASAPSAVTWLDRETAILESGVRHVFTPHQPVSDFALLYGRQDEVRRLIEAINTPGQHALLYGERGVGKSSLANIVSILVRTSLQQPFYYKRCDSQDVFESIIKQPLSAAGINLDLAEVAETASSGGGITAGGSNANVSFSSAREVVDVYRRKGEVSPSIVGEAIKSLEGLFVIDEADAISRNEDRHRLAELIKYLSDERSGLKILVVGIAATGGELTAAHPSVARCLRAVNLKRMPDEELQEIVTSGAAALKISFQAAVVAAIVRLSAGYPHFTHLLALKCAEDAVAEGRSSIGMDHLKVGMQRAVSDAEDALQRIYADSVRSLSGDMYKNILKACARLGANEFTSVDLRAAIKNVTGNEITQGSLNNYLQRLVSADGSTILRRTGQGHYRFEDPRMASFVRIANEMV